MGAIAGLLILVVACGTTVGAPASGSMTDRPTDASGFPLGSFAKEIDDPSGRIRIVWTFQADGGFTEVPVALDGQTLRFPPARGTWTADGESVTLAMSFPADLGTSRHGWRRDGGRLWTVLFESTNPDDKEWFEGLDSQPWVPAG